MSKRRSTTNSFNKPERLRLESCGTNEVKCNRRVAETPRNAPRRFLIDSSLRLPRRLGVSAVAFLFLLCQGSCDRAQSAPQDKTITVWYSWGNDLAKQLR